MIVTPLGHGRGWLDRPAALSLARIDSEIGHPLQITSAGRLRSEQQEAYDRYMAGKGSFAAKPGTSPHEYGNAIDTNERLSMLAEHGWRRPLRFEPWHYVYNRDLDKHYGKEPDMPLNKEDKDWLNGLGASIIQQVRASVPPAVWEHPVQVQDDKGILRTKPDGTPIMFPARGYLGSIAGRVGGQLTEVDETALAKQLAPLLTANLAALPDADVQRIAAAVADEQSRRLKG